MRRLFPRIKLSGIENFMNIKFNSYDGQSSNIPFKNETITCPICGEKSRYHCRVREDETLAICRNVTSDKPTKNGEGYIHILNANSDRLDQNFTKSIQKSIPYVRKADADRLNEVYTAFLNSLVLNETHSEDLLNKRGLSDSTIARNLYASVPTYEERFDVAGRSAKAYDLEGIPGFYQENGKWSLHLTYPGFYIPYRDEFGNIVGLQIRKDENAENKYLWLSTGGKERGAKTDTPIHFVSPDLVRTSKTVVITEGALKADIIGELASVGVVAMGGVNVLKPEDFSNKLFTVFPDVEKVYIAFDMDWETKKEVRSSLTNLVNALKGKDKSIFVRTWDISLGKGLDDVLYTEINEGIPEEYLDSLGNFYTDIPSHQFLEKTDVNSHEVSSENETEEINMELKGEANVKEEINTFGITCRNFLQMELPEPERVIFGLGRGNLGLMVATTNLGKTTLALNLALSAGMNKVFYPLFGVENTARRVLYIDGESTKTELQADIKKMLEVCSDEERQQIGMNLSFICDEEINDESLDLVNSEHLQAVIERAELFKPDLIIVDTLSALTLMEDENDNAIVKREVIQPLKNLAKKANAGVLILHHSGKASEEGKFQAEDAFKGRGASAFGALARVVFNLKKGQKSKAGKVFLFSSKVKGGKFESVEIKLDAITRWFNVVGEGLVSETPVELKYQKVVQFVIDYVRRTGHPVKRGAIVQGLKGVVHEKTVNRRLQKALENGDLTQPETGYYFASLNPEQELPLKV